MDWRRVPLAKKPRRTGRLLLASMLAVLACGHALFAAEPTQPGLARMRLASLTAPGEAVAPGDILRTTRVFPNWNLNCEIQLSKRRHLCAVEQAIIDKEGAAILTWSIGMGSDGSPVLALRTAPDIDRRDGIRMSIGAFSLTLPITDSDCTPRACLVIVSFDASIRSAVASQQTLHFTMRRGGVEMGVDGLVAGVGEALTAAKVDPVGLHALEQPHGRK